MVRKGFSTWLLIAGFFGGFHLAQALEVPSDLLNSLASDAFKERETGEATLLSWAREHRPGSLDVIWVEYRGARDPEIRQRCLAVLRELVTEQYLSEGSGFLGVGRSDGSVTPPGEKQPVHGVLVTGVRPGTPASRAGILAGDIIVLLDGKGWKEESASDVFANQIGAMKPGTTVKLGIIRQGEWVDLKAVLVRKPRNVEFMRFGFPGVDSAAEERAEVEAYFEDWLSTRTLRK